MYTIYSWYYTIVGETIPVWISITLYVVFLVNFGIAQKMVMEEEYEKFLIEKEAHERRMDIIFKMLDDIHPIEKYKEPEEPKEIVYDYIEENPESEMYGQHMTKIIQKKPIDMSMYKPRKKKWWEI